MDRANKRDPPRRRTRTLVHDLAPSTVSDPSEPPGEDTSPLHVLYEDSHLLAVNKPAVLLTQGRAIGERSLEQEVRVHLAANGATDTYLGTIHRLDRPVSGVVLWAKTPKAARRVARQFAERKVVKEYWALVRGGPIETESTWEDWIAAEDTGLGRAQTCRAGTPRSRFARTRVSVETNMNPPAGISWLRLLPATGRTHQLRVQAAARGLPILGDQLYGSREAFPAGIALHARSLTIEHPALGRTLSFEAPLPRAWELAGARLTLG